MTAPVLAGAEPFSAEGGPVGALVLHGFTGSPASLRPIAEALANAGLTVELPLLPGHGTAVADMVETGWSDWLSVAQKAFGELASRCTTVAVVGLSMGGTLALELAELDPDIAGLVLVNPLAEPSDPTLRQGLADLLAAGTTLMDAIGSDIAMLGVKELSYEETPLAPLLSLFDGVDEVASGLDRVRCPILLMSSREDHVVPSTSGDYLMKSVGGPCERVWLERSYHVATLDYDRDEVTSRAVDFVSRVTSAAQ
jgi:carboxylesterase